MRIDVLTLFPELFASFLEGSLLGVARKRGLLDVRLTNIRDFAEGVHRQVDDRPFGGGPGMLLMPGLLCRAWSVCRVSRLPMDGPLLGIWSC